MTLRSPIFINTTCALELDADVYLLSGQSGSIQVTLPNITADGIYLKLWRIDTNSGETVTVVPFNESELINGNNSATLGVSTNNELVSLNNIWYLV